MFRLIGITLLAFTDVLEGYADKVADEAKSLKWSQDLGALFKAGSPRNNVSALDPYLGRAYPQVLGNPMGVSKRLSAYILFSESSRTPKSCFMRQKNGKNYTLRGLGDRQASSASVINASAMYFGGFIGVQSYVTYKDLNIEGEYVLLGVSASGDRFIVNVRGNFKYNLAGMTIPEYSFFKGAEGQPATYNFAQHYVGNPDDRRNALYRGSFILSGVTRPDRGFPQFRRSQKGDGHVCLLPDFHTQQIDNRETNYLQIRLGCAEK